MMGRRLGKQLERQGVTLMAYFDIDPVKIGRTRRGLPILPPHQLASWWSQYEHPILLAAVGARGARPLIRARFEALNLVEGSDWLFTA